MKPTNSPRYQLRAEFDTVRTLFPTVENMRDGGRRWVVMASIIISALPLSFLTHCIIGKNALQRSMDVLAQCLCWTV